MGAREPRRTSAQSRTPPAERARRVSRLGGRRLKRGRGFRPHSLPALYARGKHFMPDSAPPPRGWFLKGKSDLSTARQIAESEGPFVTVCVN